MGERAASQTLSLVHLDVVRQIEQAARRGALVAGALCQPVIADGGELLEARGGQRAR